MQIQKRTMGWIQKPSAYQYSQQLNEKRRAQAQAYLDEQSALSSTIFANLDNLSYSLTENTLKALATKLQKEAEAKIQKGLDEIDATRSDLGIETSDDDSEDDDSVDITV